MRNHHAVAAARPEVLRRAWRTSIFSRHVLRRTSGRATQTIDDCYNDTARCPRGQSVMAGSPIITCPECGKKFKGKGDLSGKRIRCPFCAEAFVVGAGADIETASPPRPERSAPTATATARQSPKPPPPATRPSPPKPPAKPADSKPSPKASAKPAPAPTPPPPAAAADDDEDGKNPYGITDLDLAPRCPNCASEMESEEAVVCLHCGYNTLTREWGKTEKVIATTGGEHFLYLLPGLLAG